MQYDLSEYEIELLKSGYRDGKAASFLCGIPSMRVRLESLGLIEDFDKSPDWFVEATGWPRDAERLQLTAEGARVIGAKCQVCGEGEPVRVGPTGCMAKLTVYCQACRDRWAVARQEDEKRWQAEKIAERERQSRTLWYRLRHLFA